MDARKNSLRGLPRNLWVVTATSFLTDISSEMIFNLIPLFLANVLKAGTATIGLIDGLAETTASLMKIYSGALSDRLGTRKWITVVGYALSACAKPFLYFADAWSLVLAVRVSDRLGKGIRTAPRDALVADSIDEERRGLAFGLHRAGDTAGAFIGVLSAAVIVWMTERSASELSRRPPYRECQRGNTDKDVRHGGGKPRCGGDRQCPAQPREPGGSPETLILRFQIEKTAWMV